MSKKFLIVDDSKIARDKMSNFLSDLGITIIHHAQDGLDALDKFKKIDYDFIIMDLEMPKMKGNEASKKMLSLNPDINIILVTSIVDKKELILALKIGIKKILQKPVSFEAFKKALNEITLKG